MTTTVVHPPPAPPGRGIARVPPPPRDIGASPLNVPPPPRLSGTLKKPIGPPPPIPTSSTTPSSPPTTTTTIPPTPSSSSLPSDSSLLLPTSSSDLGMKPVNRSSIDNGPSTSTDTGRTASPTKTNGTSSRRGSTVGDNSSNGTPDTSPTRNNLGPSASFGSTMPLVGTPTSPPLITPSGSSVSPSMSAFTFPDTEEGRRAKTSRIRTAVATEIMTTEKSYVQSLQNLTELYITPLDKDPESEDILSPEHRQMLFSNLGLILNFNERLLAQVIEELGKPSDLQGIGQLFKSMAPFFKMYTQYMENHDAATELLSKLEKDNRRFQAFLKKTLEDPKSQNLSLSSYLIMPIQRIPRYQLLLKELLKHTETDHPDHPHLAEALDQVSKVAVHINDAIRRHQLRQDMLDLQEQFAGSIQLVHPSREFIKQGPLTKKCRKTDVVYEFFLFNDLLLYASKNVGVKKYKLHNQIKINNKFMVMDSKDSNETVDGKRQIYKFEIKSAQKSFIVYTYDPHEKQDWLTKLLALQEKLQKIAVPLKTKEKDEEDALIKPVWQADKQSKHCNVCKQPFGIINRRHHCRYCGFLVCRTCSLKRMILKKKSTKNAPQRVCDKCVNEIRGGLKPQTRPSVAEPSTSEGDQKGVPGRVSVGEKGKSEISKSENSSTTSEIGGGEESSDDDSDGEDNQGAQNTSLTQNSGARNGPTSSDQSIKCKAIFAYKNGVAGDLEFDEGDVINVIHKDTSGWWTGIHAGNNKTGIFPSNYVQEIRDGSETVAPITLDLKVIAISDYATTLPDMLPLKRGDRIHVNSQDNTQVWYYGTNEKDEKAGWFPSKHVQVAPKITTPIPTAKEGRTQSTVFASHEQRQPPPSSTKNANIKEGRAQSTIFDTRDSSASTTKKPTTSSTIPPPTSAPPPIPTTPSPGYIPNHNSETGSTGPVSKIPKYPTLPSKSTSPTKPPPSVPPPATPSSRASVTTTTDNHITTNGSDFKMPQGPIPLLKIEATGTSTLRKSPKPPLSVKKNISSDVVAGEDPSAGVAPIGPPVPMKCGHSTCNCERFIEHQFKKGICRDCQHKH